MILSFYFLFSISMILKKISLTKLLMETNEFE